MNEKKHKPMKKKGNHHGQTFDVMRPGRAPADATSRPAIVGHKPLVQDPMMADSGHRPLITHRKEIVPALEPAPISESMPTPSEPSTSPEVKTPPAVPVPPAQTITAPASAATSAVPPSAGPTTAPVVPSSAALPMQGAAEDIAPVLTGHPGSMQSAVPGPESEVNAHASSGISPTLTMDDLGLGPTTPAATGQQSSAQPITTAPLVPSVQLSAHPDHTSETSASQSVTSSPEPTPLGPMAAPTPKASASSFGAAPIQTPDPKKPITPPKPQTPTVAEQIAPRATTPIKPLPKEAFDALQTESKKAPTQHPGTKVTEAGIVVSRHRTVSGKHTTTWVLLIVLVAGAAFAAWYFLM